jgi:threonylcarbamoyladenosine tRNA methylthiotransferase MtaB
VYKVAFETLGCRLNQAETAVFARQFLARGYELAEDSAEADVCVINTCTLTHQATSKCRRVIRGIIRRNPDACIAAVGCYSQTSVEELKTIEGLDYIIGTADKMRLAEIIAEPAKLPDPMVVWKPAARERFTIESVGYYPTRTRANLKVQEGCNFVCSFCIIPKSRGPARSRDFDDVVREARSLADEGHREIVVTGVNVGTYRDGDRSLADLLDAVAAIPHLDRVRLSSIEPTTIDERIIDRMIPGGGICPYLHVPLQSGDDVILERMRRKYTAAEFVAFVDHARSRVPRVGFGTDVMVGFPGEEEDAFENTCRVIESIPFANVHVFSFSARGGTGAHGMPGQVPGGEIARRSRILRAIAAAKKREFYESLRGETLAVLFEERLSSGHFVGFSDEYVKVGVECSADLSNQLRAVEVTSVRTPRGGDGTPLLAVGELVSAIDARLSAPGPRAHLCRGALRKSRRSARHSRATMAVGTRAGMTSEETR